MNPLPVAGLLLAVLAIVVSTIMDGNSFAPLIGPSSFVLVLLGTIGTSLVGYDLSDVKRVPAAAIRALTGSVPAPDALVGELARCADVARRDGVLALEKRLEDIDDAFVRSGLQLIVDGVEPEQVGEMMEIDIAALDERHRSMIDVFKTFGAYAPTMGMLGTVIGLINMLGNLSDPAGLGRGMSLALLTTLYGVLFANLVFLPLGARLQRLNAQELAVRDLALDGVLAIQAGISPRQLVDRLETYLPAAQRIGYAGRMESESAAALPEAVAVEAA